MTESWPDLLAQLESRSEQARTSGASTARDRIRLLLDPESFVEVGVLAASPVRGPDGKSVRGRTGGTVCGFGRIDGRLVVVASEGPIAESSGSRVPQERVKSGWDGFVERLAREYHCPLVLLIDGLGGSNSLRYGRDYPVAVSGGRTQALFDLLDQSPVVVGVLGPVAGIAAARVVASHFSVLASDRGRVFAASAVAAAAYDAKQSEQLGGPATQAGAAGNVDNVVANEIEVAASIRRVLSYLPANVDEPPRRVETLDPPTRRCDDILEIVGDNRRAPFNVQSVVESVLDAGSFFAVAPTYGRSLLAGLARINGEAVGVLANDSRFLAGAMDASSSEKQTRLVELCDTFHLPIVYFVDVPGFMIGKAAEESGLMRRGVRALTALHRATVPVFTIQMRRSFGLAGQGTGAPNRLSIKLAWPLGEWGDMPIAGGVEAMYRAVLEAADDPDGLRQEIEQRMIEEASIWRTAEAFGIEDMIDPRDTRSVLSRWVTASVENRQVGAKPGPVYRP